MQPKNEEEKGEEELRAEALYKYLEKMLAGWYDRKLQSEEEEKK